MANILTTKQDKSLINAAIKLGDWLVNLPEVTQDDIDCIKAVQRALQKLPKMNDGTFAMYGFSIERGDEAQGLVRGWDVSLEYFANDHDRQGGLELFSTYLSIPESTEETVLAAKEKNEAYFHWPVGSEGSINSQQQRTLWIASVENPLQHWQAGDRLRLEIVYQDYYSEIDCVISE